MILNFRALINDKTKLTVSCTKHGKCDWLGHVGCTNCGKIYTHNDFINMAFGEKCICGAVFRAIPWAPNRTFTSIPACPECYKEQEKKKNEPHEPH
jgi:hypothetical protein